MAGAVAFEDPIDLAEFVGLEKYNELNEMLRLLINNFGPQDQDIDAPVDE